MQSTALLRTGTQYALYGVCAAAGLMLLAASYQLLRELLRSRRLRKLGVAEPATFRDALKTGSVEARAGYLGAMLASSIAEAEDAAIAGLGKAATGRVFLELPPERQLGSYIEGLGQRVAGDGAVPRASFGMLMGLLVEKAKGKGMTLLVSRSGGYGFGNSTAGIAVYYSDGTRATLLFRLSAEELPTAWPFMDDAALLAMEEAADVGGLSDEVVLGAVESNLVLARL